MSTIIGLTGYARSGKDTVGEILTEFHGFRRVAFGDTLKLIAEDLNPVLPVDGGFEAFERLATMLDVYGGWEKVKDEQPSSRDLLVRLGNSLRKRIPGIEVAATIGDVGLMERVVNTNVYHPEELKAYEEHPGGATVRVCREGYGPANADELRTGQHPVDYTIHNDGTIDDLHREVARCLGSLGVA